MDVLPVTSFHLQIKEVQYRIKSIDAGAPENSPVLIFLHDALGSVEQWKEFPELLAGVSGLNAILYDRQGHGQSTRFYRGRIKEYMKREAWKTLPGLLEKLEIKNPILIGHSDGGTIALLYAARFQPRAVITEAAHILVEGKTLKSIRQAATEKEALVKTLEKYHGKKAQALFSAWAATWLNSFFRDWNIQNELPKINCPALIIQGDKDEYETLEQVRKIKEGIGENCETFVVEGCGHVPHLEKEGIVIDKMKKFILEQ